MTESTTIIVHEFYQDVGGLSPQPFKPHLLDCIFSGFSYHLEMPELGEHKSPAGKGAPTEGLRSGFLEAQC